MNPLYQQTECLFYIKRKARFSDKFDPHICKLGRRKAAMGVVYVCLYLLLGGGNMFISSREPKCSDYYEHLNFRAETERIIRG